MAFEEIIHMRIKISADIRTALRKMLRGHPNILDHVTSKSQVNNLTRDNLIKLADNLEVDFVGELFKNSHIELATVMEFKGSLSSSVSYKNYRGAFFGQVLTDLKLNALGVSQTLKLKCNYENTPEWQYACLDDKRLKYRGGSSRTSLEVKVMGQLSYSLEEEANIREKSQWLTAEESVGMWDLLRGPIEEKLDEKIEKKMMAEDKVNRQKMGFPPSNEY